MKKSYRSLCGERLRIHAASSRTRPRPENPETADDGGSTGSSINDYAIIGDTRTAALVGKDGSIDWWCVPRFDAGACFAALLGTDDNGRFRIAPRDAVFEVRRRYLDDTVVLETTFETRSGTVVVTDFMVPGTSQSVIYRVVEGRRGTVPMALELVVRFDYGAIVPWVRQTGDGLAMVAGPDGLRLRSPIRLVGRDHTTTAAFSVDEDEVYWFSLEYYESDHEPPSPDDADSALQRTRAWWEQWARQCTYEGPWRTQVMRSLLTLKALSYSPTGAVLAAPTTSLPEQLGGALNWDYRYSWLRDSTLTLHAFLANGFRDEAVAWDAWLRRAIAGRPGDFQIMYDIAGRRRLTELELGWLTGYRGSTPVRIGNQAAEQVQLDVFGEVLDSIHESVTHGLNDSDEADRAIVIAAMGHLDDVWDLPDSGLWEMRGVPRHFTHSKVMAWVAYDRAVRLAEPLHLPSDQVRAWRATRERIHQQVCSRGWSETKRSFVQSYGSDALDASALVFAKVGILPADDPRIAATVAAIEAELMVDGLVKRYLSDAERSVTTDGEEESEGAFLLCSFWLVDNLTLLGRHEEARALFERLCALTNDVGLLSEEVDPRTGAFLGNFPQAFSHLGLVGAAARLGRSGDGDEELDRATGVNLPDRGNGEGR